MPTSWTALAWLTYMQSEDLQLLGAHSVISNQCAIQPKRLSLDLYMWSAKKRYAKKNTNVPKELSLADSQAFTRTRQYDHCRRAGLRKGKSSSQAHALEHLTENQNHNKTSCGNGHLLYFVSFPTLCHVRGRPVSSMLELACQMI